MASRGRDWRSILLGIGSLAGALSAFAITGLTLLYAGFGFTQTGSGPAGSDILQAMVIASAILFTGVTFLPAAYYSFQRLRGVEIAAAAPKLLKVWQGLLLLLVWAGAALLAQFLVDKDIFKWFTPPLYLLAISIPVYFLIRLASGGLTPGSRQRLWGIPVVSIALGTTSSIVAEAALLIVGLIGGAIYLGAPPRAVIHLQANCRTDYKFSELGDRIEYGRTLAQQSHCHCACPSFFLGADTGHRRGRQVDCHMDGFRSSQLACTRFCHRRIERRRLWPG